LAADEVEAVAAPEGDRRYLLAGLVPDADLGRGTTGRDAQINRAHADD